MLGYRIASNAASRMKLVLQTERGMRHLWKHFEDFLVDVEDSTSIHFIFQFSSQGSIFLSGEQIGRGIATPRQSRPVKWKREIRSRSWWHSLRFAITITPNKAFFSKKKLFSCRRGKMVVCWIFLQKISDSVKSLYLSLLGCRKYVCKFCPAPDTKAELLPPISWGNHLNRLVPLL